MIAQLRGRLVSAYPTCVVDVGGVGFEVMIPERDRERLGPDDGDIRFHTYLYVRDDRLVLYGFLDPRDRALFTRLIEVTGVGPKLALGMFANHPSQRIAAAIRRNETGFLKSLPGLGKKTAERLVMELADKLDDMDVAPMTEASTPSGVRDEVVLALTSLGMSKPAAEAVLDKIRWDPDGEASVEEVVKEALRYAGSS